MTGKQLHPRKPTEPSTRFWPKVQKTATCWLWLGAKSSSGYGNFFDVQKVGLAHKWAWESINGPVPAGFELDHVAARGCTHRHCVNPSHLEPVTRGENIRRGKLPALLKAKAALRVSCPYGHVFDSVNTRHRPGRGRECRKCNRIRDQARRKVRSNAIQ